MNTSRSLQKLSICLAFLLGNTVLFSQGIICPEFNTPDGTPIIVQQTGECNTFVNVLAALGPDACNTPNPGNNSPYSDPANGGLDASGFYPVGTTTVLFGICEATYTCSVDVTVLPAPITCVPGNPTLFLDASGNAAVTPANIDGGSFSPCAEEIFVEIFTDEFSCTETGTFEVSYQVSSEEEGSTITCSSMVTVLDTTPPVCSIRTDLLVIYLDANGQVNITPDSIDAGSTDNCGIASRQILTTFDCPLPEVYSVDLFVTDNSGNSSICTGFIQVLDTLAPTCVTQNISITIPPSGTYNLAAAEIDNGSSDNCPDPGISVFPNTFTCDDVGPNEVTLTVQDNIGNQSQCTATVTVEGGAGAIDCQAQNITISLNTNGEYSLSADEVDGGSTVGDCGTLELSISQTMFTCEDIGNNRVILFVGDGSGAVDTCSSIVNVQDINPIICATNNVNAYLNIDGEASITVADMDNNTTAACPILLSLDEMDFNCEDLGMNTVNLIVESESNTELNTSCPAEVMVLDTIPPTCMTRNITVAYNGVGLNMVVPSAFDNGSFDNCGSVTLSTPGDAFFYNCSNIGENTVILQVSDNSGNSSTCTAIVTVEGPDNAVTCSTRNITVQLDAMGIASITAQDIDDGSSSLCGNVLLAVAPAMFDCTQIGANTVVLTVSDDVGNSTTCEAIVTVEDDMDPTCNVDDLTIYLDDTGFAIASIDSFEAVLGMTLEAQPSLGRYREGGKTCDIDGDGDLDLFMIDNDTGPFTTGGASTTFINDGNGNFTLLDNYTLGDVLDIDLQDFNGDGFCDALISRYSNSTTILFNDGNGNYSPSTPATVFSGFVNSATAEDFDGDNDIDLFLGDVLSSGVFYENDGNGNFTLNAQNTPLPPFTPLNSIQRHVSGDIDGDGDIDLFVTFQDSRYVFENDGSGQFTWCALNTTISGKLNLLDINNDGILDFQIGLKSLISIAGTADLCDFDDSNQSSFLDDAQVIAQNNIYLFSEVFYVTTDVSIPDVHIVTADLNGDSEIEYVLGSGYTLSVPVAAGFQDNCEIVSTTLSQEEFNCTNVGTPTDVTITVTDQSGNTSQCNSMVTVLDTLPPVCNPQAITINLLNGTYTLDPSEVDNGSTDNCEVELSVSPNTFDCMDIGTPVTVTMTATDPSGNTSTCTAEVTVESMAMPVCMTQDITINLDANGEASYAAADIDDGSSVECGMVTLSASPTMFDCSQIGANTVLLTVSDDFGNSSTCTAEVTVVDDMDPTCVAMDITVSLDQDGMATIVASDVDGGSFDNCGPVTVSIDNDVFDCAGVVDSLLQEEWEPVGNVGFSQGQAEFQSLAIDGNDQLFVAYRDRLSGFKTTVMTYNSSTDIWEPVGNVGLSQGRSNFQSLAIDGNNKLYVAYEDNANGDKTTVMTYDSSTDIWEPVGNVGLSQGRSNFQSLAIDGNDQLFVAYQDETKGRMTTVMTYNSVNSTWESVGNVIPSQGEVRYISLVIDGNDELFVAFQDWFNGQKTTVMSYNSGSNIWDPVGNTGFSQGGSWSQSLAIDGNDQLFVAYQEAANDQKTTVMTYDSSTDIWEPVGNVGLSQGRSNFQSLAIDGNNKLYVAYEDNANGSRTSVMTYYDASQNSTTLTVTDASGNTSQCTANVTVQDTLAPQCPTNVDIVVQLEPGQCDTTLTVEAPIASDNCDANPTSTIITSLGSSTGNSYDCPIDILFIMDNSGSINSAEYDQMEASALVEKDLIAAVFPNSRFATVHYFGSCGEELHIENDFTIATNITSITRQGTGNDDLNNALGLVMKAVDGVSDPNLYGGFLSKDPASKFCVVIFTDAPVGIPFNTSCPGTALLPYDNRNLLESNYGANFTVVHFEPTAAIEPISASIASVGGTWTGAVDNNPGDPQNGITPRQFIPATFGTPSLDLLSAIPVCSTPVDTFAIGTHTIEYEIADQYGNTDTCSFNIEVLEYVPDGLSCKGNINFSLDPLTCSGELTIDDVLTTDILGCSDSCKVSIKHADGSKTPAIFDASDIGQTYQYEVCCAGICCWGEVLVEYKYIPEIECDSGPFTAPCTGDDLIPAPTIAFNCSGATVEIVSEIFNPYTCDPEYNGEILRSYQVVSADGVHSGEVCTQTILLERVKADSLNFPMNLMVANDKALSCSDAYATDENGNPDPSVTGAPTVTLSTMPTIVKPLYPGVPSELCNIYVTYEDSDLLSTDCVRKIKRTWTIGEWHCTNPEPRTQVQFIEIADFEAPVMAPVADMEVSTSAFDCTASISLPIPTITDNCNPDGIRLDIGSPVGIIHNYIGQDLLMLPVGDNMVIYNAYDGCGNGVSDTINVRVVDNADPIAICDEHTAVSIGLHGYNLVPAASLDDGSFDECGPVSLLVARMDDPGFDSGVAFRDSAMVTCDDIGREVMMALLVTDKGGNTNMCMVSVEVQDKIEARLSCPPAMEVECNLPFDPDNLGAFFGEVQVFDNCPGSTRLEEEMVGELSQCGNGLLVRTVKLFDANDIQVDFCSQAITFRNATPITYGDVTWPRQEEDYFGCVDNVNQDELGMPTVSDEVCQLIGMRYEDQFFPFNTNGTCQKIIRTWFVIDWCLPENEYGGTHNPFTYEQVIKLNNIVNPEFDSVPIDSVYCSYDAGCTDLAVSGLIAVASDDCTEEDNLLTSYKVTDSQGLVVRSGPGLNANGTYKIGTYEIKFEAEDRCGNVTAAQSTFEVRSCKTPTPYCLNGLSTALIPMDLNSDGEIDAEMVMLTPDFFDGGSYHPCGYDVVLSFSSDINDTLMIYNCDSIGNNVVQLWVTDVNGNQDYCTTFILVEDNNDVAFCDPNGPRAMVQGRVYTDSEADIEGVTVALEGGEVPDEYTGEDGAYQFGNMPLGNSYVIAPSKDDDHRNGVNTLDLVMIQRHILGLQLITNPYQLIAADVNHDEKITPSDLLALRKLILGVSAGFPNNTSWRFIDEAYVFEDPSQPLSEDFDETYAIGVLNDDVWKDFIGLKVGDINGDAAASMMQEFVESRSSRDLMLQVQDVLLKAGQDQVIEFHTINRSTIHGLQLALELSDLEIVDVSPGELHVTMSSSATVENEWRLSHGEEKGITVASSDRLFSIKVRSNKETHLSDAIQLSGKSPTAEAYVGDDMAASKLTIEWLDEEDIHIQVQELSARQNTPNPWSQETSIEINTPTAGDVLLRVTDTQGKLVHTESSYMQRGRNVLTINSENIPLSGIYFYEVYHDGKMIQDKMIKVD